MKRSVPAHASYRMPRSASGFPEPQEESSRFWFWVGLVALGHLVLLVLIILLHPFFVEHRTPPIQFISLMPSGSLTQGTPGVQQSQKVAQVTMTAPPHPAPVVAPPVPVPQPVIPPTPTPPTPTAQQTPTPPPQTTILPPPTPVPSPLAKPTPLQPHVDLTEVERTVPKHDKPKHHHPKPVTSPSTPTTTTDTTPNDASTTSGLSPDQIASELGQKLQNAGVAQAIQIGPSGSDNSQPDRFSAFYAALRDQTMNLWQEPQVVDKNATNPVVQIHVNPDGTVPSDRVVLLSSSGDTAYDNSALTAARSLGKLTQPLPDGCPPDISINFTLTH